MTEYYFIRRDGKVSGPLSHDQVQGMAKTGDLWETDDIRENDGPWESAAAVITAVCRRPQKDGFRENAQTGNSETDNSGSDEASRQKSSTPSRRRFAKYPAIGVIVLLLRGVACLWFFVGLSAALDEQAKILPKSLLVGFVVFVGVVALAFAELLSVGVDIERNTASRKSDA